MNRFATECSKDTVAKYVNISKQVTVHLSSTVLILHYIIMSCIVCQQPAADHQGSTASISSELYMIPWHLNLTLT